MAGLLYREDMDEVRARLTAWWNGGDIGRPVMQLCAPRGEPIEGIPALPEPEGWTGPYSTADLLYRVNLALRQCLQTRYLGDAVPCVAPDLAPNCLALYLGCRGVETPGTVWCEPCMAGPEDARFVFDESNLYWQFSFRLAQEQKRLAGDKQLIQFPDLIEGLDTLAAMRGNDRLLIDLLERPEWVHACLRQITDRYFHCYDLWYELIRDEVGGSCYWAWAPGRMAKFQCDFSAMIGPGMFREFMGPVLREMTARVGYCMYHWDGPSAIVHHDCLLEIPDLDMLQWTPGAGVEPVDHPRWWPLYHKTVDAGKKVYVGGCSGLDQLRALRREFGGKLNQFLIAMWLPDPSQADEALAVASGRTI